MGRDATPFMDRQMTFTHAYLIALLVAVAAFTASADGAPTIESRSSAARDIQPDWAYADGPFTPPARGVGTQPVRVPDSTLAFAPTQLSDFFFVPDWYPTEHPMMPEVVSRGRKPGVLACGYCHLPDGAGRPENSSLAGLPAAYIEGQLRDFSSGARRSAIPDRFPVKAMADVAAHATGDEAKTAAKYFADLTRQNRTEVIETQTVPSTHVVRWIHIVDKAPTQEPIGQRIIEVPKDAELFERRDAHTEYIAYVPVGAVVAGHALVDSGPTGQRSACTYCHGPELKGVGPIPAIAGRSPSYIMRQLFDIKSGHRAGERIAPMAEVANNLTTLDMLQISAYLATLK
jgi:cytochrome c553